MKTVGLNYSLLISVFFHLILILLLSLTLPKNPFLQEVTPIVVEINSPTETLAGGLEKVLDKSSSENAPLLKKRLTRSVDSNPVKEKLKLSSKAIRPDDPRDLKKKIQKAVQPDTQKIKKEVLKEKVVKPNVTPREDVNDVLDDFFEKEEKQETQKQEQIQDISDKIDSALDESAQNANSSETSKIESSDPLKNAKWSSTPRKTLFFPDIQSKIPKEYRKKGMGYSVKVKIAFDMNGLAVRVDLIESSGDPVIDNLFMTELRKIRVESSTRPGLDEISKTFTISVK